MNSQSHILSYLNSIKEKFNLDISITVVLRIISVPFMAINS